MNVKAIMQTCALLADRLDVAFFGSIV